MPKDKRVASEGPLKEAFEDAPTETPDQKTIRYFQSLHGPEEGARLGGEYLERAGRGPKPRKTAE